MSGDLHTRLDIGDQFSSEERRLQALYRLNILDTPSEADFEDVVEVAASICGTPVAVINLIDYDRIWFKAKRGIAIAEAPREHSFCKQLIGTEDLLEVTDTFADPRFATNPNVTGEAGVRFYARVPINRAQGHTLGALCVTDQVPHELSDAQRAVLKALARQVMTQMELRGKLEAYRALFAEKERVEIELRRRTTLFTEFMDHTPAIGFIKDEDGRFLYYNKFFCERFAVSPNEWLGKSVFDLFPEEFATAYHDDDLEVLSSGTSKTVDETSPGPAGSTLYWRTHKFAIVEPTGVRLLGGLSFDVSSEQKTLSQLRDQQQELEVANVQLTELSLTDGLTGLSNRRAFDSRLQKQADAGTAYALVLLDLDFFKKLNDCFGHPYGDEVLKTIARLLKATCRDQDCVARFGGEEFAILLIGVSGSVAQKIAERMRRIIEQHIWPQRGVTASLGLAVSNMRRMQNGLELLAEADQALYRAKQSGRNQVCHDTLKIDEDLELPAA